MQERRDGAYKKTWSDNKKTKKQKQTPSQFFMLNQSIIMGRVVRDPELRTKGDFSATSFSVAVDRDYKDRQGNTPVDFIDVKAKNKTAEFICKYFGKGSMILVMGPLEKRQYEKNGVKVSVTEISAERVSFAGQTKPPASANATSTAPADNTEAAGTTVETVEGDDFGDLDFGDLNFG